jgi:hypothetical protein
MNKRAIYIGGPYLSPVNEFFPNNPCELFYGMTGEIIREGYGMYLFWPDGYNSKWWIEPKEIYFAP